MEASDTVTTALFSAFLKCPRKACFLSRGERPPDTYFSDVEAEIASMCKSRALRMLHDRGELSELVIFGQLADVSISLSANGWSRSLWQLPKNKFGESLGKNEKAPMFSSL